MKQLSKIFFTLMIAVFVLVVLTAAPNACCAEVDAPGIQITSVPADEPGDSMAEKPIKGTVVGIDPKEYKIVIYAFGGDKWYVQPTAANPLIDINKDKTWESATHGGLKFAALIVKPSYKPAPTAAVLPKADGDVIAVSEKVEPQKN